MGLVVEEALYFGMPVIVSENCGACDLIKYGINGYTLDFTNLKKVRDIIININDDIYQNLIRGVSEFSLNAKDIDQVKVYDVA